MDVEEKYKAFINKSKTYCGKQKLKEKCISQQKFLPVKADLKENVKLDNESCVTFVMR